MARNIFSNTGIKEIDNSVNYPLMKQMNEIINGTHLNACLIAASLRPEIKIAIKEFVTLQGGYEEVAHKWFFIMQWVDDELKKGSFFDRELRDMLIGLAAAIRAKQLRVR